MAKEQEPSNIIDDEKNINEKEKMEVEQFLDEEVEKEVEKKEEEEEDNDLEVKIKELKDQLMRTLADGENLRKRTLKEVEQAKKYSHISFVRDLVSSVDNLKRALDSIPEDKSNLSEPIKNLILGLEIVEKEIVTTLEKNNIKQISPLGEKFDYNFHQAMFEIPTNECDPGLVVEVSQNGYLLYDRLVRPAMVGISKKIEETNDNQETAG
ncbi:nucleotide exchange factor GrpE [Pseudomonadota bacterium]|nr:nucleotide exchange factor GrpE [Pseudomonadota bacterium]